MQIIQQFQFIASSSSAKVALTHEDRSMTYGELDLLSNQIAHAIRSSGVRPADVVGICVQRSPEMVATLLGILKSGAAYLPLDPSYPLERLKQMVQLSKVKKIVSSHSSLESLKGEVDILAIEELDLTESAAPLIEESRLCYVIYTSGSSGTPKGVAMGHRALANLIEWQNSQTINKDSVTLQFTPVSFDVHFQEIFSTLTLGGRLVLVSEEDRLDPSRLLKIVLKEKVNRIFMPYVALNHFAEVACELGIYPPSLTEITTAGEQLKITPAITKFFTQLKGAVLYNHYGPSESHVVSSLTLEGDPKVWAPLPAIGKAIHNCEVLLLDEKMSVVAPGSEGELYLRGICLAEGYLHAPELTSERFLQSNVLGRIYKTGDIGFEGPEGDIVFCGRKDGQVKIRGYRIETGEIEITMLGAKGVKEAVVIVRNDVHGELLCAYYSGEAQGLSVRRHLRAHLPEYMVPAHIIHLERLPLTPSGKVEHKSLPAPSSGRPELSAPFIKPTTAMQQKVCSLWQKYLGLDLVGIDDGFFDLGGSSLLALKFIVEFNQMEEKKISVTDLFSHSTVRSLANYLAGAELGTRTYGSMGTSGSPDEHAIAVVAMTGRFPGAANVDEFWANLVAGKNSLQMFQKEEAHPSVPKEILEDENYVAVSAELPGQEYFDCKFFGMTPREAELMDPQQRKFLELANEALETSGYNPDKYTGSIGIFAGMGNGLYGRLVDQYPEKIIQVGEFNVMLGLEKDYIATRVAFKLNLTGPALSIHTGCSTSLVAIIEAVKSLRMKNCDMALAGGISISGAPKRGHLYQEGGILSKDGTCRPFDEAATGTVFSDGAGVVVLKRLKDALNDGDSVLAVIKGVGINNDGSGKMSFTAPSVAGQIDVVARAQADAKIDLRTVGMLEAHGTATPVGDPIEVEALTRAFRKATSDTGFCLLGSVKSNIGHLTAAAGVAGFIKLVMSVNKGIVPGTVHYKSPNKLIDLTNSPFTLSSETKEFPKSQTPRRAAMSSLGVGGTNGHLIIEEFKEPAVTVNSDLEHQLFKLSAKSEAQLSSMRKDLIARLRESELTEWPKIAYTLETGRKDHEFRAFLIAKEKSELELTKSWTLSKGRVSPSAHLTFLFPGQGSQYPEMGKGLYESSKIFAAHLDHCCEMMNGLVNFDMKAFLFDPANKELLHNTFYTQPAIFIIEYCLAKTLMDLGLRPTKLLGHSVGEYVAATISGIFSLEDGLRVIVKRAELISELPPGVMLSVGAEASKISSLIGDLPLDIAVINGAQTVVVAGETTHVESFKLALEDVGIAAIQLKTSHAFHSRMMAPAVSKLWEFLETIPKGKPSIPMRSSVTGQEEDEVLQTSEYWAKHILNCVDFAGALSGLTDSAEGPYLEVGPSAVLSNLVRRHLALKKVTDHRTFPVFADLATSEHKSFLRALGELWLNALGLGAPELLFHPKHRRKVATTTYAFEEQIVWLGQKNTRKQTSALITRERPLETKKKEALVEKLTEIFEASSGIDVKDAGTAVCFLELGMDSLLLTQIALQLKKEFKVNITFRQLLQTYSSIDLLTDFLMDKWEFAAAPVSAPTAAPVVADASTPAVEAIINRQLELMNQQLGLLRGTPVATASAAAFKTAANKARGHDIKKSKEAFGAAARIHVEKSAHFTPEQAKSVERFFRLYNEKTKESKKFTQENRKIHADPRVVTGFRPESKEIIYPVVVKKSLGQKLWDIDGNEYIDMTCGFGSNFFGNGNPRIKAEMLKQIEEGIEVGPQHPLVADVSKLITELTGNERSAFCNTGSEAVLGAMRLARTVTGREKIIVFSGSYHGINDEVIIRTANSKSFPAAPGINNEAVSNMIVLDYGTPESLEIIRSMAHEAAAVLVEPVQSRRCDFHPAQFLKEVRKITQNSETCLIFDEVITGFRIHAGGAQAHFGIRADLCTYGKIVGGGMPIGVISGKAEYMDALDGGHWNFGDDSTPTVGVTYFAGTFVRHPLALAAAKAALEIIKEGAEKQLQDLNESAQKFVNEINDFCEKINVPFVMNNFGPLMKPKWKSDVLGGEYLFALLRFNGVHVYDGFPWFVNLAHTEAELRKVLEAIKASLAELQAMGLLPGSNPIPSTKFFNSEVPPLPAAKLGRDEMGNPAWFIERAGEHFLVEG
jgi:amino acid adenylation domain-containing protein